MAEENVRKAAILLMSLPEEQAAQILSKLTPKQVEVVSIEIAKLGRKAHAASADLAKGNAVRGYVRDAVASLGGVDLLVNNASAFGFLDDDKGWGASLAVVMMAIVHATQEAYPALKKAQGSVVNISSIAALHPCPAAVTACR